MAEDGKEKEPSGPVMLAATRVLHPGPVRIGSLSKNVTLPRTVQLNVVLAGAFCAVPGLVVGLMFGQIAGGWSTAILGALAGAFIGKILVTWSPYEKESLARFFTVVTKNRKGRIEVDCAGAGEFGIDRSDDTAVCPSCYREVEVRPDGAVRPHTVLRRFYIGICQLPSTIRGEITVQAAAVDLTATTMRAASA